MSERLDKLGSYLEILLDKKKGTEKQKLALERYRFSFSLSCEGYTPLVIAKVMSKHYDISESRSFKIIREAKQLFGDAATFSKKGERYALYEYMMRMSKNAEKAGDYSTARNCAMDAAKLLGLDQPDLEGMVDPLELMNPDEFVISSDPKILDAVHKTIELIYDIDHEVVETIAENVKAEEKNS